MSQKLLLFFAAFSGFFSVAAGAFAAHALKDKLSGEMLAVFETGARYQMYHGIAIFLAVWVSTIFPGILAPLAGWFFFSGTVLFSGSLYLLALTGMRFFGAITPIGGLLFLAGWLSLMIASILHLQR